MRALVLVCCVVAARDGRSQGSTGVEARRFTTIDSMVAAEFANDSVGSLTVGVVSGANLVWTATHGYADMATHRFANRQSIYHIGSITKPFTAVMLLTPTRGCASLRAGMIPPAATNNVNASTSS